MRILSALSLCALALYAVPAQANPFQFPLKPERRHLVDRAGRPFFFQADTATALFTRLTRDEAVEYLRHRRIHGYTAIAAKLTATDQRDRGGHAPFRGGDVAQPDEAYFEHADQIIRSAEALGLLLALSPAEGLERTGVARARELGRWLGRRYARHAHIIWVVDQAASAEARALGAGLRETAPLHLIAGQELAFVRAGDRRPARPYVVAGALYEGEPNGPSPAEVRRQAYVTILGGAIGHAYGSIARTFPAGWRGQLDLPGGASLAHVRRLFESRPWQTLVPDGQLVSDSGQADPVTGARAPDGSFAVVYVPGPRKLSVHARRLGGRQIVAWWWDPRTGQARQAGMMATTGTLPVVTPGPDDWVLVLDNVAKKFPEPGTDPRDARP
jgi:hypothetical protein